ncbi:signal peptidase I [Alteribacillus bidgolensis]|uniref:Signal peptidase I n=1 Tax=Alteribacillus bidgolensis TaxID=930129 RepID=A0A1G8GEF4_9BACI|nr:signal peptidase I [Alteribacillus bidgolensis]SDH92730.1 type I signal peptidase. Serine peptidase. MEROPS family S26A [Alteribacillus bidgolensis]
MYQMSDSWKEWIRLLFFAVTIAIVARTFLIAPIIVDGESMAPTLADDDRMIINKTSYWFSDPERFDVIVFHASEEKDYIKRVIGVPGDTLYYDNDSLYINDKKIPEPYLQSLKETNDDKPVTFDFTLVDATGMSTIPEGHVFVLGDNRRHSFDSRSIGLVETEDIVGEAEITFWPVSHLNWLRN